MTPGTHSPGIELALLTLRENRREDRSVETLSEEAFLFVFDLCRLKNNSPSERYPFSRNVLNALFILFHRLVRVILGGGNERIETVTTQ